MTHTFKSKITYGLTTLLLASTAVTAMNENEKNKEEVNGKGAMDNQNNNQIIENNTVPSPKFPTVQEKKEQGKKFSKMGENALKLNDKPLALSLFAQAFDLWDIHATEPSLHLINELELHKKSPHELIEMFQKTPSILNVMAWMSYSGEGAPKNINKAIELYTLASDLGNINAMCNLADMYENGEGVPQDYEKAIKLYTQASDLGDANGMNYLAWMYLKGKGVPQNSEKVFELYTQSSNLGHAVSMCNLAEMYENGEGVPQNYEKAIQLYTQAIELGNISAMCNLADIYANGAEGVDKDYEKAFELYTQASRFEYPISMYNLGMMYYKGECVKDWIQAYSWIEKAAKLGNENAKNFLNNHEMEDELREWRKTSSKKN